MRFHFIPTAEVFFTNCIGEDYIWIEFEGGFFRLLFISIVTIAPFFF